MRMKHLREPFFAKGERAVLALPEELHGQAEVDELHRGRRKLRLSFTLPRGAYATMLIKRLAAKRCG